MIVEKIPLGQRAEAHPFCGYVVNINCVTRVHRDWLDMKFCVCFALGDWEGGQLVIDELGLVFDLKPGHVLLFDSTRLTHFNLHYMGLRISVVLNTDKEMERCGNDEEGLRHVKATY